MHKRCRLAVVLGLGLAILSSAVGCQTIGPNLGPFALPIPVSPYFQEKKERQFRQHERYDRAPVLPPLAAGGPTEAVDRPSDEEVMYSLERARPVSGGFPFLYEVQRNNVQIIKEKIADYVDPPRVMPLVGPVQLHHAHYKCTVTFTETVRVGWPIPHTLEDEEVVEVLYIDHNHLHMVGNVDDGATAIY